MPSRPHPLCPRALFPVVSLLAMAVVLGACSDSPTDVHSSPPSLSTLCQTAGTQVSCTASYFNGVSGTLRDVTADATWLVADPSVGVFVRP